MSTISPNMGLIIPTPNVTPGPQYATDLQASLNTLDTHDHSSGKGVAVGVAGLNLQADLSHNGYRITNAKSLILSNQIASLAATDARGIYCLNNDLYYVNGTTNVQITSGTSIAGANGTIAGLVSPASAVYNAGQFEFYSASATAANVYAKDYTLYNNSLATTVKLTQSASISYVYTLPAAVPSTSNAPLVMSTGGVTSASSDYTLTSAGIVPTTNAVSNLGSAPLRYSVLYVYAIEALGNANFSGNGIFGGNGSFSGTFFVAGTTILNAQTTINGAFLPATNNTFDQGTSGNRWRVVYASTTNSTTVTATTVNSVTGAFSGNVTAASVTTDNVAVKQKKLTGTTSSSGSLTVAHGLTDSKIRAVAGVIQGTSGAYYTNYNTSLPTGTAAFWDSTNIYYSISGLNAEFGSRPTTILVTYEA